MGAKIRPSLEEQEIQHIVELLDQSGSSFSLSIAAKLKLLLFKYNLGAIKPAYKTESVEEKLGMVSTKDAREITFAKWQKFPDLCTLEEINAVEEYRYEMELMTEEEAKVYEAKLMEGFSK